MKIDKELLIRQIVIDYCRAKPNSTLAKIKEGVGFGAAVKMVDIFGGQTIAIPVQSSLKRSAKPMLIQEQLYGLNPNSSDFKEEVKKLAKIFKIPKRAVEEMNKTGVYKR